MRMDAKFTLWFSMAWELFSCLLLGVVIVSRSEVWGSDLVAHSFLLKAIVPAILGVLNRQHRCFKCAWCVCLLLALHASLTSAIETLCVLECLVLYKTNYVVYRSTVIIIVCTRCLLELSIRCLLDLSIRCSSVLSYCTIYSKIPRSANFCSVESLFLCCFSESRLNKEPPNLSFRKKEKGGINLTSTVTNTHLDLDTVKAVCSEYRIHNADITLRFDATADDLIDVIEGSRVYMPCIYVINKIDQITLEELEILDKLPHYCPIR